MFTKDIKVIPSFLERLESSLENSSITTKCHELSVLLEEAGSKDALFAVGKIVENLFELSVDEANFKELPQCNGWNLCPISYSKHSAEYQTMRKFLSPSGPLLNCICRLCHDPSHVLKFAVSKLPVKVQNEIKGGSSSPFYMNSIEHFGLGKPQINILLNPFEFYFFHFCYFIVGNGAQQQNSFWNSLEDLLFPTLLEEYLLAYLPTSPSEPFGISNLLKSSFSSHPQRFLVENHSRRLYNSSSVFPQTPLYSDMCVLISQNFVQIVMEIWVNICISPSPFSANNGTGVFASPSGSVFYSPPSLKNVFVPVSNHVRAIRMMIKHFHFFSNSFKPNHPSLLDPLKKNIWTLYKKNFYFLMKHLFIHWPLDSSFRLPLETWLSFIQPWRYTTYDCIESVNLPGSREEYYSHPVDQKWKIFVAENLLFYTSIFNMLIKRAFKFDLYSSKISHILFRVAKVFSQENLTTMIKEIEESVEINSLHRSYITHGTLLATVDGANEVQSPQMISQLARCHILELEIPNYHYEPMFGDESLKDVYQVMSIMKETHDHLNLELIKQKEVSRLNQTSKFMLLSTFKKIFKAKGNEEKEISVNEIEKSVFFLNTTLQHFSILFNINAFQTTNSCSLQYEEFHRNLSLESKHSTSFLNESRQLQMPYTGNPDKIPISSFEIGFLVRFLYICACKINDKYSEKITEYYHRRDFFGNIFRSLVKPPCTVYECNRNFSMDMSSKITTITLPPRLCFRILANKKVIFYIMLFCFSFYVGGYSLFKIIIQVIIPACFVFMLCKVFINS